MIDTFGIGNIDFNTSDIPIMEYPVFDLEDTAYTDPSHSYWNNPSIAHDSNDSIIIAKILRVNKKNGTMRVIGINNDIHSNVPIPSSMVSSDQRGNVSMPSADAHVVLGKMPNGEYAPLNYIRQYSDELSYGTGIPDEIEEGDLGWHTSGGGKLFMFENGMLQVEAAPNCARIYFPLDDGEKIQDMCREYDMVTDAGNVIAGRRGITEFTHMKIEASESAGSNPAPLGLLELGSLDDLGIDVGSILKTYKSNVNGVTIDAGHLKILKDGKVDLNAELDMVLSAKSSIKIESATGTNIKSGANVNVDGAKINLGGETAVDPVVLGLKLQAEIEAIKTWLRAHIHTVAPVGPKLTAAPSEIPLVTPGGYLSSKSFVL